MRRGSGEEGLALVEVLLLLLVLAVVSEWALPSALRLYKYGAVRYEAEQLLSDLRWAQMDARTTAQQLKTDGRTEVSGTRPRLLLTGTGYIIYQGRIEVRRHNCLASVRLKFNDGWEEKELLDFYAGGKVYPSMTIKVFSPGAEGIGCKIVIDAAGRIRLARS